MRTAIVQIDDGSELECVIPDELAIQECNECIVENNGVLEYGKTLSIRTVESLPPVEGKRPSIVRRSTLQDQTREHEKALLSKIAFENCEKTAAKYQLQMRLVKVNYSFDRTLLNVLFAAEERVDFRQMIKDLSTDLKVRVEMKQIGIRDEAGIVGGVSVCGRKMCCCSWLEKFESIKVKMAKTQRLSLNPNAISGMCGRLKCCLNFENDAYNEMSQEMPKDGARMICPEGKCIVVDKNIIMKKVKVRTEDNRILDFNVDEVHNA